MSNPLNASNTVGKYLEAEFNKKKSIQKVLSNRLEGYQRPLHQKSQKLNPLSEVGLNHTFRILDPYGIIKTKQFSFLNNIIK